MKADKPGFWAINICISLAYTLLLDLLVNVSPLVFFCFFLWMVVTRASKARQRELNARMKMNTIMLAELLEKQDKSFDLNDLLEDFDLTDDS